MAVLPSSTRYANFDITKVYFLPTIANASLVPTRAEITAGTDLTGEVAEISGWLVEGASIETPDLASEFVSSIPGRTRAADSSITFYADQEGSDVRDVLPRGTNGYILWADGGDVTGQPADVFPVRVMSVGKTRSAGDESARIVVTFSITATPAEDVALPATS